MIAPSLLSARANGNQAIALAALDGQIGYFSHYPGSPVNNVDKDIIAQSGCVINNALNEHVACLSSAGASFAGARSLLVMKHVGLNIAADPLNYIGYAGCKGGMVLVVGTDPGARSSTGEEDVHWYGKQCNVPIYEPTSVQGIYDSIVHGFTISETHRVPVMVFVPGRLAYQSEIIRRSEPLPLLHQDYRFEKNRDAFINAGQRAVNNHRRLIERIHSLASEQSQLEQCGNQQAPLGIITRGLCYAASIEAIARLNLSDQIAVLNVDRVFPLHKQSIVAFAHNKHEIIVIEDQDGFLEQQITFSCFNDLDCTLHGKDLFPAWGEITQDHIVQVLAQRFSIDLETPSINVPEIPERMGTFCEGCPHRGSFFAIDHALKGRDAVIGGDIGCSSLPPFRNDWLLCMNAGVGISQGISDVSPDQYVISTGGEGSFFHGGVTSLQSAVENNTKLLHIILDNESIAMTGHQDSPSTNAYANIPKILHGIGVKHIFEADPFKPLSMSKIIRHAVDLPGVKVIWARGKCALQADEQTLLRRQQRTLFLHNDKCGSCRACYTELQCPAIQFSDTDNNELFIDMGRCMRCAECLDICPHDAIEINESISHVSL